MTLREALDRCTISGLFDITVSDEHTMQVIDKIMSAPSTKVMKVKLCNIITWLLKKVEWQEKRIEKLESENRRIAVECHRLVNALEQKQKEMTREEKQKCLDCVN